MYALGPNDPIHKWRPLKRLNIYSDNPATQAFSINKYTYLRTIQIKLFFDPSLCTRVAIVLELTTHEVTCLHDTFLYGKAT